MREKELFDILEDAEYDSLERLIDKCPEMSDEQLDRIFEKSEKKFNSIKKDTEIEKNIKVTENDDVEGVDIVKRPVWLGPLSAAASIVLIAGIAIGSTFLMKKPRNVVNDDSQILPAVTATTTRVTGTSDVTASTAVSAVTSNIIVSGVTGTDTLTVTGSDTVPSSVTSQTSSGTETTAVSTTVTADYDDDHEWVFDYEPTFTGQWIYQTSPNNTVHTDGVDAGIIDINESGNYTFTDRYGNTEIGTVKRVVERINLIPTFCIEFSGNAFAAHRAYYTDMRPDEFHFGNGDAAIMVPYNNTMSEYDYAMIGLAQFRVVDDILLGGFGHRDDISFVEGNTRYYKVSDPKWQSALAELRSRINKSFTGEAKDYFMKECDARFREKDGELYETNTSRERISVNINYGVGIENISFYEFIAESFEDTQNGFQSSAKVDFVHENGEWKIKSYSIEND